MWTIDDAGRVLKKWVAPSDYLEGYSKNGWHHLTIFGLSSIRNQRGCSAMNLAAAIAFLVTPAVAAAVEAAAYQSGVARKERKVQPIE